MCGIAGTLNFSVESALVGKKMGHRGPDERGLYGWKNLELHHLRLSIQDIALGQQPMHLGDRFSVILNGEIYNHLELREKHGLQNCHTNSDTETLLLLFEKMGLACLDEFDGMFAFALLDKKEEKLWLVRDRAGKKPFYFFEKEGKVAFASELNCLRAMTQAEADDDRIAEFLRLGLFASTATVYKNIVEVEAGGWASIDLRTARIEKGKWWQIGQFYQKKQAETLETALLKADSILGKAIKRRIEASDLEVGSFLSSGIDSGLVTAIGSKFASKKLKTFTVAFDGPYDESPLAAKVAERYDTDHSIIRIDFSNLQNDLETIIGGYGEPFFDSSAIPSFYVSREARKHLTVILNGDGADELFGGYRRYWPYSKLNLFSDSAGLSKFLGRAAKAVLPMPTDKKSKLNFAYRLADLLSRNGLERYLSSTLDIFEGFENALLFGEKPLETLKNRFSEIEKGPTTSLQKIMQLDFETILTGDLLVKMDIATMAHSLEGRSPFLCKEFLEWAPGLPDDLKIRGRQTKFLLRELAKKYLPDESIHLPKKGFEIPLRRWLDEDLNEILNDHLLAPSALFPRFVDKIFVQKLLEKRVAVPAEKRAKMLWSILCLEIWHRKVEAEKNQKTAVFA